MGKILSGILSKVSGKVAGVVGGSWKDVAYLRAYVKPANPNTAAQQVQRTKFSDCVDFAKPLVGPVFNAYTDKFQKSMSGFNFFIKRNIAEFDGSVDYSALKVTEGPLSAVSVTSAQYITDTITISFTANPGNNGLDTDKVYALAYHTVSGLFYFAAAETTRVGSSIDVVVLSGQTASQYVTYTLTAQEVNNVLERIANSRHYPVTT